MTAVVEALELRAIPLRLIERSPHNPRRDESPSPEMVDSVRQHGILQPILVRPIADGDDGYQLIAGHRRLSAAEAAGLDVIPAIIRAEAELEALELTLIENLHRADLSPLEEAEGFKALADLGLTQKEIAEKVNVSQPLVSKRLGLLRLPEVAKQELDSGGITIEQATAMAVLTPEKIEQILKPAGASNREWAIRRAVQDHQHEKARAKKIDELTKAGITVIDDAPSWHRDEPPIRLALLSLPADLDHSTQPCHAVWVTTDGRTVEACTKPDRHPEPAREHPAMAAQAAQPAAPRETAEQKAELAEIAARFRARRDGELRRREFCEQLLEHPASWHSGDVIALASYLFTCNDGYETDVAAAMSLLGHDDPERNDPVAVEARDRIVRDQKWGTKFLLALALDIGLAVVNDGFDEDREFGDPALQPVRFFLAWLETRGYELDDMESLVYGEQLTIGDGGDPEPAPEPAASFTIAKKGKRFVATCSTCGPLSKVGNTTENYARLDGTNHLSREHGITAP